MFYRIIVTNKQSEEWETIPITIYEEKKTPLLHQQEPPTKRRRRTDVVHQSHHPQDDFSSSLPTLDDNLINLICSYLPWKDQVKKCRLVSKQWSIAVGNWKLCILPSDSTLDSPSPSRKPLVTQPCRLDQKQLGMKMSVVERIPRKVLKSCLRSLDCLTLEMMTGGIKPKGTDDSWESIIETLTRVILDSSGRLEELTLSWALLGRILEKVDTGYPILLKNLKLLKVRAGTSSRGTINSANMDNSSHQELMFHSSVRICSMAPRLEVLDIVGCPLLTGRRDDFWDLLPNLRFLNIRSCHKLCGGSPTVAMIANRRWNMAE